VKQFFAKLNPFRAGDTRFGRYYAGVIGQGSGYPTADEARRDLRKFDQNHPDMHWMH
jgi:hypothetical protein